MTQPSMDPFDSYKDLLVAIPTARVYLVGGVVRDKLMDDLYGTTTIPHDVDFVVTGVSESQMNDALPQWESHGQFKVYIHPITKCEFALARTEVKVGASYTGFEVHTDPTITIEADLFRRDLTINSMAIDCVTGVLVDPYGGWEDIRYNVLRPTSSAFVEDPLRVLRVARFAARFGEGWTIHHEIMTCVDLLRINNEFTTIHPNRIVAEIQKALLTDHPELFFVTCEYLGIDDLYNKSIDGCLVKLHKHNLPIGNIDLHAFCIAFGDPRLVDIVTGLYSGHALWQYMSSDPLTIIGLRKVLSALRTFTHKPINRTFFTALSYLYGPKCLQILDIVNACSAKYTYSNLVQLNMLEPISEPGKIGITVHSMVQDIILGEVLMNDLCSN